MKKFKYYAIKAAVGHVGSKKCYYKTFWVKSTCPSTALMFNRASKFLPGIKHNGIVSVKEISAKEYQARKQNDRMLEKAWEVIDESTTTSPNIGANRA